MVSKRLFEIMITNIVLLGTQITPHPKETKPPKNRAEHAEEIIDTDLGKGHSNACEATFKVFPKFRPKDVMLHRLHYQASTNLVLLQSSMTYLFKKRGPEYHWMMDLGQCTFGSVNIQYYNKTKYLENQ